MRYRSVKLVAAVMAVAGALVLCTAGAVVRAEQPQEEFVPIDQLPPDDQLPAAPLLVAAYAIVWIVVFVYLWSIWKRQDTIEREISDLSQRTRNAGSAKR